MDYLALLYAMLGGFFMGTYPVPIKNPQVLKAKVHPVVFQCYKSFFVFVTGFLFLIPRALRPSNDGTQVFEFSWWGVVSAAGWIPSGLTTIFAVPIIGVGLTVAVAAAASSALSFMVFWLILGEPIKAHSCGPGCTYYLAPVWLVMAIAGMGAMVLAPRLTMPCDRSRQHARVTSAGAAGSGDESEDTNDGGAPEDERTALTRAGVRAPKAPDAPSSRSDTAAVGAGGIGTWLRKGIGVCSALGTGVFAAIQYGAVTEGKRVEQEHAGCADHTVTCPAQLKERFDNFGSWMASFGIGAALCTACALGVLVLINVCRGTEPAVPHFHFGVMRGPGTLAGLCWCLGNFFNTAAVVQGGNAVEMPQLVSFQLFTSGCWGILYYHESRGWNAVAWVLAAGCTLTAMLLLGTEKDD